MTEIIDSSQTPRVTSSLDEFRHYGKHHIAQIAWPKPLSPPPTSPLPLLPNEQTRKALSSIPQCPPSRPPRTEELSLDLKPRTNQCPYRDPNKNADDIARQIRNAPPQVFALAKSLSSTRLKNDVPSATLGCSSNSSLVSKSQLPPPTTVKSCNHHPDTLLSVPSAVFQVQVSSRLGYPATEDFKSIVLEDLALGNTESPSPSLTSTAFTRDDFKTSQIKVEEIASPFELVAYHKTRWFGQDMLTKVPAWLNKMCETLLKPRFASMKDHKAKENQIEDSMGYVSALPQISVQTSLFENGDFLPFYATSWDSRLLQDSKSRAIQCENDIKMPTLVHIKDGQNEQETAQTSHEHCNLRLHFGTIHQDVTSCNSLPSKPQSVVSALNSLKIRPHPSTQPGTSSKAGPLHSYLNHEIPKHRVPSSMHARHVVNSSRSSYCLKSLLSLLIHTTTPPNCSTQTVHSTVARHPPAAHEIVCSCTPYDPFCVQCTRNAAKLAQLAHALQEQQSDASTVSKLRRVLCIITAIFLVGLATSGICGAIVWRLSVVR